MDSIHSLLKYLMLIICGILILSCDSSERALEKEINQRFKEYLSAEDLGFYIVYDETMGERETFTISYVQGWNGESSYELLEDTYLGSDNIDHIQVEEKTYTYREGPGIFSRRIRHSDFYCNIAMVESDQDIFWEYTNRFVGYKLAFVLGSEVLYSATIVEPVKGNAQVTGIQREEMAKLFGIPLE